MNKKSKNMHNFISLVESINKDNFEVIIVEGDKIINGNRTLVKENVLIKKSTTAE